MKESVHDQRLSIARAMVGLWMAFGDMLHEYAHRCYDRARAWEKEVGNIE